MDKRILTALLAGAVAGCAASPRGSPLTNLTLPTGEVLYANQADYPALVAEVARNAGDLRRIIHLREADDLLQFTPGSRYQYVVDACWVVRVAPEASTAPLNPYHHPVLASGGWVRGAGHLTVRHSKGRLISVSVDNESSSYRPAPESLEAVASALTLIGVPVGLIQRRPVVASSQ